MKKWYQHYVYWPAADLRKTTGHNKQIMLPWWYNIQLEKETFEVCEMEKHITSVKR